MKPQRFQIVSRLLFFAIIWISGVLVQPSLAGESKVFTNPAVTARLISAEDGVAPNAASVSIGLALEFGDGWKGYWRTPGEVGLAPSIDWAGSSNLNSANILWPAPERFEAFGIENFGYANQVVLPIRATLEMAGHGLDLRAQISLLTCSDVCVPHNFELSLALPEGVGIDTGSADLIARFVDRVPLGPEDSDIQISSAAIDDQASALTVSAQSTRAFRDIDVFPEFGPLVTFGKPDIRLNQDRTELWAQIPINAWSEEHPTPLITITDTARAVTSPVSLTAETPVPPYSIAGVQKGFLKLIVVAGVAFLGGLILNVMPCVLPVLSIKLASVLKASGQSRDITRKGFLVSALGVLTFVWSLAAVLLALQWVGVSIGWGMQFQNSMFVSLMFVVIAVFAANLLGAFEIALPQTVQDRLGAGSAGSGYAADFGTGFLAAVLATPCSAPLLGTAVTFALAGTPLDVAVIFTALGFGLSFPYLVIAARPEWIYKLPRPGRWMVLVRMGLGGLLLATATWLLFVLLGVAGNLVAVVVLTATVAFVVGATVNWSNLLLRRIFLTISFVAATFGAGMFADPDRTSTTASAASHWQEFAPLEIARHVSEGHTVFVDVTADWCLTCKANKTLVLDRSPVIDRLSEEAVISMQADWTRPDQKISRFLERHQRYAIPFNIVFGPRAPAGITLPEVLTPTLVLDALERASNL